MHSLSTTEEECQYADQHFVVNIVCAVRSTESPDEKNPNVYAYYSKTFGTKNQTLPWVRRNSNTAVQSIQWRSLRMRPEVSWKELRRTVSQKVPPTHFHLQKLFCLVREYPHQKQTFKVPLTEKWQNSCSAILNLKSPGLVPGAIFQFPTLSKLFEMFTKVLFSG